MASEKRKEQRRKGPIRSAADRRKQALEGKYAVERKTQRRKADRRSSSDRRTKSDNGNSRPGSA